MVANVLKKPHVLKNVDLSDTRIPDGRVCGALNATTGLSLKGYVFTEQRLRILFDDVEVTITDTGANGAHGSLKLFGANAGLFFFKAAISDLDIVAAAGIGATGAVVCGLGTATVGVDNATLSSTEQDLIPSTSVTLAASAGTFAGESTSTEGSKLFDGTSTAKDVYLNFAVSATDATANSTLTLNGWVDIVVALIGDQD